MGRPELREDFRSPLDAHLLEDVGEEASHSNERNVEPLAHHVGLDDRVPVAVELEDRVVRFHDATIAKTPRRLEIPTAGLRGRLLQPALTAEGSETTS